MQISSIIIHESTGREGGAKYWTLLKGTFHLNIYTSLGQTLILLAPRAPRPTKALPYGATWEDDRHKASAAQHVSHRPAQGPAAANATTLGRKRERCGRTAADRPAGCHQGWRESEKQGVKILNCFDRMLWFVFLQGNHCFISFILFYFSWSSNGLSASQTETSSTL